MSTTLFSWGYWGWGNCAAEFVRLVDAVEKKRGFKPPLFVDIRIRHQGRAPNFAGKAFEAIVGTDRYLAMKDLGNLSVLDHGDGIRIAKPEAAAELLAHAVGAARDRRRVIFYCSCKDGGGYFHCHRRVVASLVLSEAKRAKQACQVEEWPGGEMEKTFPKFKVVDGATKNGTTEVSHLRLEDQKLPVELGAIAWATPALIVDKGEEYSALIGPPRMVDGHWAIALMMWVPPEDRTAARSLAGAKYLRKELALA